MLKFGSTLLPSHREPPRPDITPKRRVVTVRRGTAGAADYREDWGLEGQSPVRFVSSETQGFMTAAEVAAVRALYEAGASFALETDLLKPLGETADAYSAFMGEQPTFSPATPSGSLYRFDILVWIN